MVGKYEIIKTDGGQGFFSIHRSTCKGKREHRGYEALIITEHYDGKEEAEIAWNGLHDSWKKAVDAQLDKSKADPESKKLPPEDIITTEGGTDIPKGETQKIWDEIKELRDNVKKSEPEKVKDIKAIMARVEKENREQVEKINKQIDELTEDKQNLAKKLQQAIEANNTAQVALVTKSLETVQQNIDDKLLEKSEVISEDKIKKLMEFQSKPWFQKIPWKSPWTYAKISLLLVIIFIVIGFFIWIWGKIKSAFFIDKQ